MDQDQRINEALRDYYENPEDYSFSDLEELFEDRDPTEFL